MFTQVKSSKEGQYRYILDWLSGRNEIAQETDKINMKELTFNEALARAERWHQEVESQNIERIEDEDGDVVITFPDRFYWVKLNTSSCTKEARAMGHCGRGAGILYSLRKDGYSYITADIGQNGELYQMRGRANTKPKSEYHKYIIPFLNDFVTKLVYNSYYPEKNFRLGDLSLEDTYELIESKPELIRGRFSELRLPYEERIKFAKKYPELLEVRDFNYNIIPKLSPDSLERLINLNPEVLMRVSSEILNLFNFTPEQKNRLTDLIGVSWD